MSSRVEKIESLVQALPYHIFRLKADGEIIDFHYSKKLPPSKKPTKIHGQFIHDLNLVNRSNELIQRCIQDGAQVIDEYLLQDGKNQHHMRARFTPQSNDEIILTLEDLPHTPAKKVRNSSFKKLALTVSGAFFRTDSSGVFIEIGESVPFELGLKRDRILGKSLESIFRETRKLQMFMVKVKATRELVYGQVEISHDNRTHQILLAAEANFDQRGIYKGITGLIQRISSEETDSTNDSFQPSEALVVIDLELDSIIAANQTGVNLFKKTEDELKKSKLTAIFPSFSKEGYKKFRRYSGNEVDYVFNQRILIKEEQVETVITVRQLHIGAGKFCQFSIKDVTAQNLKDKIEKLQQEILRRTISGEDNVAVLKHICTSFEEIIPGSYCTYLKYDPKNKTLNSFVSSGMPKYYTDAIKDVKIGPDVGACGRAAFIKKMVFMSDILNHPNWKSWLSVLVPTGMKSCWSVPVLTGKGEVLGTFSVYYKAQKLPKRQEIKLINQLAYVIGLMVEKANNEAKATYNESRYQSLLDHSPVGIAIHLGRQVLFMNKNAKSLLKISADVPDEDINKYLPKSFLTSILSKKVSKSSDKLIFQEMEIEDAEGGVLYVMMKANKVRFDNEDAVQVVFHDITPRREAEKKLIESQQQFELAIKGSSAGIWDWYDIENGEVWWSPKIYELLGYQTYNANQPGFDEIGDFIHPEDTNRVLNKIKYYLANQNEFSEEFRLRVSGGGYKWFLCSGQAVWDKNGRPTRMVGSIVDIHVQKSSQQQLKSREQLLNRTGTLGKIGGWEVDLDDMRLIWTDQTYNIHELDVGQTPELDDAINFYHPEDRASARKAFDECVRGKAFSLKFRLITARGNQLWIKAEGYPVYSNKKVIKLVGAIQDITNSESQQLAIQESEQKLRMTNKIAQIGFWQWNLINDTVYWSDEFYDILEVGKEQIPSMESLERAIHPAYQARYFDYMLQSMSNKELEAKDIAIICPDSLKVKYLSIRSINTFDSHGRIEKTLGTIQDITDRKQLEISLNNQNKHIRIQHHLSQTAAKANNNWFLVHTFCQALVEEMGYDWVWISSQENLALGQNWPVAHCVHQSYEQNDRFNDLLKYEKNGPMQEVISGESDYLVLDVSKKNNKYKEWLDVARQMDINTVIYLPYYHDNKIHGTINIYSCTPTDLSDERFSFLMQFADKLGSSTYSLELKKNKEELNDFNKLLVDSLHVASVRLDKHSGQVVFTGDTEALVGYTEEELVGLMSNIKKHFYANDVAKFNQEMEKSRNNNGYFNFDFKFRNKEGRFVWLNAIGKTYWQFNSVRKVVGIVINTDEKKTEEMSLMRAQIIGRDKERARIAQQLHDGLGQLLTVVSMGLSSLKRNLGTLSDENEEIFIEAVNMVDAAILDSRQISHELMPAKVKKGLVPAIDSLVARLHKAVDIKINFFFHNTDKRYSSEIETNFYYIINEIVNNILKHSKATKIDIQLLEIDDLLVLMIDDDGIGFDLDSIEFTEGIGLRNIKSRVLSINGELTIESKNGTQVLVEIRLESNPDSDDVQELIEKASEVVK